MRQQRYGWAEHVWKVYLRRCSEGKADDKVTHGLLAEFRRANKADKQWEWTQTNPEKAAAKDAVYHAVARGGLVRPSVCSRCGAECQPIGHHHSYEKEDRLSVEWLCPKCHRAIHAGG